MERIETRIEDRVEISLGVLIVRLMRRLLRIGDSVWDLGFILSWRDKKLERERERAEEDLYE